MSADRFFIVDDYDRPCEKRIAERREVWRRFHGIATARHSGEEVIPAAKQWMAHTVSGISIHPPAVCAFGETEDAALLSLAGKLLIQPWEGAFNP